MHAGRSAGILLLLAAGAVLGTIAWKAKEPTYSAPVAPENVPFELSGDVPAGCVVRGLDVEGMCCDGCTGKLYDALTALDPVREAAVDPVLERVAVVVPAELDTAVLEAALTFDKYSARARD